MEILYQVAESPMPIFSDAYLLDGDRWIFGSFWANETALQEFFARLSLPNHEQGLRQFTLKHSGLEDVKIRAGHAADLTKLTAKTPATSVLGVLCNVWIFDPVLQKPNRSNGEAFVMGATEESQEHIWLRAWSAVQELSQIPLLDHWQEHVMQLLADQEWITPLTGHGAQGYRISLPAESLEQAISDSFKRNQLAIEATEKNTELGQGSVF